VPILRWNSEETIFPFANLIKILWCDVYNLQDCEYCVHPSFMCLKYSLYIHSFLLLDYYSYCILYFLLPLIVVSILFLSLLQAHRIATHNGTDLEHFLQRRLKTKWRHSVLCNCSRRLLAKLRKWERDFCCNLDFCKILKIQNTKANKNWELENANEPRNGSLLLW
jgi:hypothetical protein